MDEAAPNGLEMSRPASQG